MESETPRDPADRIAALEARVVDLEVRLTFQQQTIDDLDAVVRDFAERTRVLERELVELRRLAGPPPLTEPSADDYSAL